MPCVDSVKDAAGTHTQHEHYTEKSTDGADSSSIPFSPDAANMATSVGPCGKEIRGK